MRKKVKKQKIHWAKKSENKKPSLLVSGEETYFGKQKNLGWEKSGNKNQTGKIVKHRPIENQTDR